MKYRLLTLLFVLPLVSAAESSPWIEYHRYAPEILDRDPTPALRIYDDGRFLVYRPKYRLNPGLWEGQLSAAEFAALIKQVESAAVRTLDIEEIAEQVTRLSLSKQAAGELIGDSEESVTYIAVDRGAEGRQILSWMNLQSDSEVYEVEGLSRLAQFEKQLMEHVQHEGLRKIAQAKALGGKR